MGLEALRLISAALPCRLSCQHAFKKAPTPIQALAPRPPIDFVRPSRVMPAAFPLEVYRRRSYHRQK